MSQQEESSLTDKLKIYFETELKNGYQVTNEDTANKLRNMAQQKFKIKSGSMRLTRKILAKVMQDMKLSIPENLQGDGANLSFKIQHAEPIIKPTEIKPANPHGTLPAKEVTEITNNTGQQLPTIKTPEQLQQEKDQYLRMFERGFDFLPELYEKLGLIATKKKPETQEELQDESEKFRDSVKKYSQDVGMYCYEHGVKIPTWIEVLALICGGFLVLGKPIIDKLLIPDTETKKELTDAQKQLLAEGKTPEKKK